MFIAFIRIPQGKWEKMVYFVITKKQFHNNNNLDTRGRETITKPCSG